MIYYSQLLAPKFKDTLEVVMPLEVQRAVGLNKFVVSLDYFGQILN